MRIAPINNTNPGFWKTYITDNLIRKVNERMIESGPRKLTDLDKFADLLLDKKAKGVPQELKRAKEKFDLLSKYEQDKLLLYAKCRKAVNNIFADEEKVREAYKRALDSVLGKK